MIYHATNIHYTLEHGTGSFVRLPRYGYAVAKVLWRGFYFLMTL